MSAINHQLALEAVRVAEVAALAASKLIGLGDEKAADQAAVDAMRTARDIMTPSSRFDSMPR